MIIYRVIYTYIYNKNIYIYEYIYIIHIHIDVGRMDDYGDRTTTSTGQVPAVNFNEAPCSWFGANPPPRILVKFHEFPIFCWRLNGAISTELAEFDDFFT